MTAISLRDLVGARLGIAVRAAICVAFCVSFGATFGVPVGVADGAALGVTTGVVVGVVVGAPSRRRQSESPRRLMGGFPRGAKAIRTCPIAAVPHWNSSKQPRMNIAMKFLCHQAMAAIGKKTFRFPFGAYFYLTFRCNMRCSYCDGGSGESFPEMVSSEITPGEWRRVMAAVRPHTDVLLLSGGEPLVYDGFREVVADARKMGFSFISLNTNGLLLEPAITESLDAIIVSLDSLDRKKSDLLWNRSGATDRVLRTLEMLSGRAQPSVMVNSVILPENIPDVEEVLNFCIKHGFTFSAGPALDRTRPVPGLSGNPDFQKLIRKIIAAKRAGHRIAATVDYLKSVSRFRSFDCHPLLVWRVYPDGSLVYPCSRQNRTIGSLVSGENPETLFRTAADGEFFINDCREACPLSCYMDTSFMIQRPLGLLREGFFRLRSFSSGHRLLY